MPRSISCKLICLNKNVLQMYIDFLLELETLIAAAPRVRESRWAPRW